MTTNHPKAYTVEEIDGKWSYFDKNGRLCVRSCLYSNTEEGALEALKEYKQWDDFNSWRAICGNLSDESLIKGARKYDTLIRQTIHLQNWLRDELLMRLILKNL